MQLDLGAVDYCVRLQRQQLGHNPPIGFLSGNLHMNVENLSVKDDLPRLGRRASEPCHR